jgi:putative membrane protein
MLLHDAGLAWLHFLFAFIMVGALVAEAFILRLPVDGRVARLLSRVDLFYGISAGLVILAGVSRVIWGAKGWAYYQAQPFFWAKMATFALIGLISIPPTLTFLRWNRAARADASALVPEPEVKRVRLLVVIETHLLALLLLFATLMARGIGFGG